MNKTGPKPKKRVEIKWSSNFAYAIGLLTADGNLSKDGRHIDFTSKDIDLIESFKKCLNINEVKVGKKYRSNEKDRTYFRVQFSDVNFYRWCLDIGLTPNKSKTIKKLKIADRYFFDFLRGCFDGDGTIYSFWDKRWKSSFMFYISIASASKDFLLWLQNTTNKLAQIKGYIGKGGRGTWQLRFAKKESYLLFDKMFYHKNVCFLDRKFIKAKKIFHIDKQNKSVSDETGKRASLRG